MRSEVKQPESLDIAPGLYDAVFDGRDGPLAGKFGDFIIWKFIILVDGDPEQYTGLSSDKFISSRRCKGWRWAQAIDPSLNEETINWDDEVYLGVKVKVQIDYKVDEENGFLSVQEVFPWLNRAQGRKSGGSSKGQVNKPTLPPTI